VIARLSLFLFLFSLPAAAQLTKEQRLSDFRHLADLYARRYAGVEWKKSAIHFDLLDIAPWLDRVAASKSDLEFYDVMIRYVASLQDAHDEYALPSDFVASLGFTADVYEDRLLIDSIDTAAVPRGFPLQAGDEIVSVDGKPAAELVRLFSTYVSGGNPRTTARMAASLVTRRAQTRYPWAHEAGESAAVEIRMADGSTATHQIAWRKSGEPLVNLGPSPGPYASARAKRNAATYTDPLTKLRTFQLPGEINIVGFGRLAPVFRTPASWVQGLGTGRYDSYYTGTYKAEDGTRVGYLRIPSFSYISMRDLDAQIQFFEANTDVLVVDVMRNPGGNVCSAEQALSRLTTKDFFGAWAEVRVTWIDVLDLNYAAANPGGFYDPEELAEIEMLRTEYTEAYQKKDGRTRPLPICGLGPGRAPAAAAYTKPVLFLADEMSASAADMFVAMVQDNKIGPVFGYRTMGAGGSPWDFEAGVYSEGYTTVTRSLAVRNYPVVTPDFPTTSYIENVGVRPDLPADYMTVENLKTAGDAFVNAFTAEAVKLVKK
jgi:hypothetical protein